MARQGLCSTSDLRPLLKQRGIEVSASQTYRLVVETPERLSLKTLMTLLDILGCPMQELIEPVQTQAAVKAAGGWGRHREQCPWRPPAFPCTHRQRLSNVMVRASRNSFDGTCDGCGLLRRLTLRVSDGARRCRNCGTPGELCDGCRNTSCKDIQRCRCGSEPLLSLHFGYGGVRAVSRRGGQRRVVGRLTNHPRR
ncbi:XRE family transcriptional regulator [Nakamurella silvestris]|nr:XRE family transcriptional regulator [Nakamurella silvestris]